MKFAGPDKIDTRKLFYDVTALIGIGATLGETMHVLQPGTADNIANLLQAIGQFIPTAGVTAAAIVLRRQAKVPGMLEPTPPPQSPLDQVMGGVQAALQVEAEARQAVTAATEIVSKIQQAAKSAFPAAPQVNYNITARDTEDAFVRAQQRDARLAAQVINSVGGGILR